MAIPPMRGIFGFVAQLRGIDLRTGFRDLQETIVQELGLRILAGEQAKKPIAPEGQRASTVSEAVHDELPYSFEIQPFDDGLWAYWAHYGIYEDTLRRFRVCSLKSYRSQMKEGKPYELKASPTEPIYAYIGNGYIKVYRPNSYHPRYYHNDTHAFTANNLYKLKNEAELNTNLIFFHDREQAHGSSQTTYFLPEGIKIIREDLRNRSTINQLEGELRYNINKDKLYFNNLLELKASWEQKNGMVSTSEELEQQMRQRYLSATNTSHWVHMGEGGRGIDILWRNALATIPTVYVSSQGSMPLDSMQVCPMLSFPRTYGTELSSA